MAYDFDTVAARYDRMNHLMTAGLDRLWRKRAVHKLAIHNSKFEIRNSPFTVLDVACGTGDLSLALLRQGCTVTGVDLSEEMLKVAREKILKAMDSDASSGAASAHSHVSVRSRTEAKSRVAFQIADAEALPFPDATFDAVTCAFGIRNFVHLEQGLAEMHRVLKPGGQLVLLELSTPDSRLIRPFYSLYTHRIIPLLGHWLASDRAAYTYLPASIDRFPKGVVMLGILDKVGFASATHTQYTWGVCRCYCCFK